MVWASNPDITLSHCSILISRLLLSVSFSKLINDTNSSGNLPINLLPPRSNVRSSLNLPISFGTSSSLQLFIFKFSNSRNLKTISGNLLIGLADKLNVLIAGRFNDCGNDWIPHAFKLSSSNLFRFAPILFNEVIGFFSKLSFFKLLGHTVSSLLIPPLKVNCLLLNGFLISFLEKSMVDNLLKFSNPLGTSVS